MTRTLAAKVWTAEQRAEALALYVEVGPSEAGRRLGIPKHTIASWARRDRAPKADVEAEESAANFAMVIRERTLEERRSALVEKLGQLAELGVDWTREALVKAKAGDVSVRDAVGVFTRAIHDLQLLSGGATSRLDLGNREVVRAKRDELAERRARKNDAA